MAPITHLKTCQSVPKWIGWLLQLKYNQQKAQCMWCGLKISLAHDAQRRLQRNDNDDEISNFHTIMTVQNFYISRYPRFYSRHLKQMRWAKCVDP